MKYKYHVVYYGEGNYGSITITTNHKIDSDQIIEKVVDEIKRINKIKTNIILLNWIKLRTTENMWLRLKAIAQTLLRKASHILKRCTQSPFLGETNER